MFDQEQIAVFFQRVLMVVGGFAAGYLLTWLAGAGFDRVVVKGASPAFLHRWARIIGGAVVALVVAFLVFRGGKGGGDGTGDGNGTGPASSATSPNTSPASNATPPPPKVTFDTHPVYVTVYAGAAVEPGSERFYALGKEAGPKVKLADVTAAVLAEKKDKKGVLLVYALDPTASTGTPPFGLLAAEAARLEVGLMSRPVFEGQRPK